MKKLLILLLIALFLLSAVACGGSGKASSPSESTPASAPTKAPDLQSSPSTPTHSSEPSVDSSWMNYRISQDTTGTMIATVSFTLPELANSTASALLLPDLSKEYDFADSAIDMEQIDIDEQGNAVFTLTLPEGFESAYLVIRAEEGRFVAQIEAGK